jgi:hypothetical protein
MERSGRDTSGGWPISNVEAVRAAGVFELPL